RSPSRGTYPTPLGRCEADRPGVRGARRPVGGSLAPRRRHSAGPANHEETSMAFPRELPGRTTRGPTTDDRRRLGPSPAPRTPRAPASTKARMTAGLRASYSLSPTGSQEEPGSPRAVQNSSGSKDSSAGVKPAAWRPSARAAAPSELFG